MKNCLLIFLILFFIKVPMGFSFEPFSLRYTLNGSYGYIKFFPVIDENDTIYVVTQEMEGSNSCTLRAFSSSGYETWSYYIRGKAISPPYIGSEGVVYLAINPENNTQPTHLFAISPQGFVKWQKDCNFGFYNDKSSVIEDKNGTIIVASKAGMSAFKKDGSNCGLAMNPNSFYRFPPIISKDGTIWISAKNGELYGYYPSETDGHQKEYPPTGLMLPEK